MKKIYLIFLLSVLWIQGNSQITISGNITSAIDGNPVDKVNIIVTGSNINIGSTSDKNGFYALSLPGSGNYIMVLTHIGYHTVRKEIVLKNNNNMAINIEMIPELYELEPAEVNADRIAGEITQLPSRTSIMSRKEIESYPASSTDDLLRSVANLVINRSWGIFSKNSSVTMRGMDGSARTLILVDGVPINKTAGGSVTWEMIKPEQIERIEVIKGPNSALYGNNAMAGIINIHTKKPHEGLKANIGITAGSMNVYGGSANISGRKTYGDKSVYFDINSFYREGDGYIIEPFETRDSNNSKAYLKEYNSREMFGVRLKENHKLEFEHIFHLGKHGAGKKVFEDDGSYDQYRINLFIAKYKAGLGKADLNIKLFYQQEDYDKIRESMNSTGKYKLSEAFSLKQDYGLWSTISWQLSKNQRLTMGFDAKKGILDANLIYRTSPDNLRNYGKLDFYGFFARDEISLLNNKFKITAGIRFDVANFYESGLDVLNPTSATGFIKSYKDNFTDESWNQMSPKISFLYNINNRLNTFLSFSTGFMPPKLDDLTRSGKITKGFKLANPELQPETITSYEWGWNIDLKNKVYLKPSVYFSKGKDFQYFVATGDSIDTGGSSLKPVLQRRNITEVEIKGAEITIDWQIMHNLKMIAAYAYNHSVVSKFDLSNDYNPDIEGKFLIEVPKNQASLSVFWQNNIINTSLIYSYMGSQWYNDENTQKIDACHLIDLKLSKKLFNKFELQFIIQDLFDEQFIDRKGRLSPGRFIIAKAGYHIF